MRRCITIFLIGLLAVFYRGLALAAWPSVAGEVAGELKLFDRSPEFVLPWKLTLRSNTAGGVNLGRADGPTSAADDAEHRPYLFAQEFSFTIDTSGTQLVAGGRINPVTGQGTWRIEEGNVDAAVWFGLIAPQLGPVFSGAFAQGALSVSGEGTLCQGQAVGRLKVEWRDGVLAHVTQGWMLEGVGFKGEFDVDVAAARLVSTTPFELTVRTVKHTRFGARNMVVHGLLNEQRNLALSEARVEIAGGEMVAEPSEMKLSPVELDMNLHISRVGLQDIVLLVPAAGLADARGRIDGEVRLKWSAATDFQVGVGHLELRDDEPTVVRLSPTVGLLTGRLEPYIDLSAYIGKTLGRFIHPKNPAYKDLQSVELGKSELRVSSLRVNLTPDGDENGRSATVQFVAQPMEKGSTVKQVTFDVNVAGPLNAVLKLGLRQNFSLDAH